MGLNYSGFETLLNGFKAVQKEHEKFIRGFLLEMGMRALAQTIALTPVDTGDLQNRWELSSVMRRGDELYVVLFNNLSYASHVEDGHKQNARWVPGVWRGNRFIYDPNAKTGMLLKTKWIPGIHMARISITKLEFEIPARYERALKEFMKGLGVGG